MTGTVIKNTGSSYLVRTESGENLNCKIKGNFRLKGIRTTNPVAVGDHVTVSLPDGDTGYITAIAPRRNYIIPIRCRPPCPVIRIRRLPYRERQGRCNSCQWCLVR